MGGGIASLATNLIPGGGLIAKGLGIATKAIGTLSKKNNPLGAIQGAQIPAIGGIETLQTSSTKSNAISGNTSGSNSANASGNNHDQSVKSVPAPVKLGLGYGIIKLLGII